MRRVVEKGRIHGGEGSLEWVAVRSAGASGVLFVPPLVGGLGVQQIRTFRPLIRRGYHFISFDYAGHGRSSGKFSPNTSCADTLAALRLAGERSNALGLPLYGVGCCYAAMPLIHATAAARKKGGPAVRKLVLVNAILSLDLRAVLRSFWDYYRRDFPGTELLRAAERYLEFLFPGIHKSAAGFGALERRRTRLFRTVTEALSGDPLNGIQLPRMASLCIYARHDNVLSMYDKRPGFRYEQEMRRILPESTFLPLKADHFLSRVADRRRLCGAIAAFLKAPESDKVLIRP